MDGPDRRIAATRRNCGPGWVLLVRYQVEEVVDVCAATAFDSKLAPSRRDGTWWGNRLCCLHRLFRWPRGHLCRDTPLTQLKN